MAARLSGGNNALALLCNTLATGAILVVIITIFAPISGAHFNPTVTLVTMIRGELNGRTALAYILVQIVGGCPGALFAHLMFGLDPLQISQTRAHGARAVVWRVRGYLRANRDDPWLCAFQAGRRRARRWPLHHLCLLVNFIHVICQSRGDHCSVAQR
jgi:glycerol uptake facilitator-like aquaporin